MTTKVQQQKIRRHRQARAKIENLYTIAKLGNVTSFENFINCDTPTYDALSEIIKLAKKHRKITLDLLDKRLISNVEVKSHIVKPNETLYNELKSRYDPNNTATKQLKHENSSTEKFTNIIFLNFKTINPTIFLFIRAINILPLLYFIRCSKYLLINSKPNLGNISLGRFLI